MQCGKQKNNCLSKLFKVCFVSLILANAATSVACQSREKQFDELFDKCSALSEKQDTEKAVICFEEAVKLNPESYSSYISLAVDYKKLNQLDKAEEVIKKALAIHPKRAGAYQIYGEIFEQKGNLEEALKKHERTVELKPKVGFFRINLAFIQEKLKEQRELERQKPGKSKKKSAGQGSGIGMKP